MLASVLYTFYHPTYLHQEFTSFTGKKYFFLTFFETQLALKIYFAVMNVWIWNGRGVFKGMYLVNEGRRWLNFLLWKVSILIGLIIRKGCGPITFPSTFILFQLSIVWISNGCVKFFLIFDRLMNFYKDATKYTDHCHICMNRDTHKQSLFSKWQGFGVFPFYLCQCNI